MVYGACPALGQMLILHYRWCFRLQTTQLDFGRSPGALLWPVGIRMTSYTFKHLCESFYCWSILHLKRLKCLKPTPSVTHHTASNDTSGVFSQCLSFHRMLFPHHSFYSSQRRSGSIRPWWLITLICITVDSLQPVLTFFRVREDVT